MNFFYFYANKHDWYFDDYSYSYSISYDGVVVDDLAKMRIRSRKAARELARRSRR